MSPYKLVLATDLDGTFLEGDAATKQSFYSQLMRQREDVLLIYSTGRPIRVVQHFCQSGYLPPAHFVMGDHGTHIVDGTTFAEIEPLQNPIIEKWNNRNDYLRNLLAHEEGIELQPIDPPYRVAYYYDTERLQKKTVQKITEAGFDVILSSDMYLDIVSPGVNKGSSLIKLLNHFDIPHHLVVTAGDAMNDLSLFQTGLKGIAVGNAEPKLVEEIKHLKNVYHSSAHGILGIQEGLQFYKIPLHSPQNISPVMMKV
ncbi:MAG: HAD-IIB family hydrolase [Verrucomicrobia bacterium]|nr:HAD-IIB family hydrolase [Verrucomicrobiota bacterium]